MTLRGHELDDLHPAGQGSLGAMLRQRAMRSPRLHRLARTPISREELRSIYVHQLQAKNLGLPTHSYELAEAVLWLRGFRRDNIPSRLYHCIDGRPAKTPIPPWYYAAPLPCVARLIDGARETAVRATHVLSACIALKCEAVYPRPRKRALV